MDRAPPVIDCIAGQRIWVCALCTLQGGHGAHAGLWEVPDLVRHLHEWAMIIQFSRGRALRQNVTCPGQRSVIARSILTPLSYGWRSSSGPNNRISTARCAAWARHEASARGRRHT